VATAASAAAPSVAAAQTSPATEKPAAADKTADAKVNDAAIDLNEEVTFIPPSDPKIQLPTTLIPLPCVRQSTNYTCGVAALQSILAYHQRDWREDKLSKALKANPDDGTSYNEIVNFARQLGFEVEIFHKMGIDLFKKTVKSGVPVLVCLQAWTDDKEPYDWKNMWDSGHYVVCVGYNDEVFFFMDPSTVGQYAYIPHAEFLERWHDCEGANNEIKLYQLGITIKPPKAKEGLPKLDRKFVQLMK